MMCNVFPHGCTYKRSRAFVFDFTGNHAAAAFIMQAASPVETPLSLPGCIFYLVSAKAQKITLQNNFEILNRA